MYATSKEHRKVIRKKEIACKKQIKNAKILPLRKSCENILKK